MSQPSSVMSRQDFSSLCWNLYRDMEKSVAPCLFVFSLFLCRDLNIFVATSKLLFIMQYVVTLNSCIAIMSFHYFSITCHDFVSLSGQETLSSSVAIFITLSRHNFFIQCRNRIFQVAIISVVTGYFMS